LSQRARICTHSRVRRANKFERANKAKPKTTGANKLAVLEAKIKKLDQHLARVLEQSRRDSIAEYVFEREVARTHRERTQVQRDIAALKARGAEPAQPAFDKLRTRIDSPDLAVRREILRAVLGASGWIMLKGHGSFAIKNAMVGDAKMRAALIVPRRHQHSTCSCKLHTPRHVVISGVLAGVF
jgi:hypothetical protein